MEETPKAKKERVLFEELYPEETWLPILPPPDETIETVLDWHSQGCDWPVGGDETTITKGVWRKDS